VRSEMSTKARVPASIRCRLCGEACKRGVSLACCSTISCRACATKSITTIRTCWGCGQTTSTAALVNDEQLRQNVERFNKGDWVPTEEELQDEEAETSNTAEDNGVQPPAKKGRMEDTGAVTLQMMQDRNTEFDRYLLPLERSCKELRFGAQLELIFQFNNSDATCQLCSEALADDLQIKNHLIGSHQKEFGNLKIVLREDHESTLDWISKAIQSEFIYQTEKIFPVEVK